MYFINPNLYVIISPPGEKCGLALFASFAFLFRASCPSPLLHPSMGFALRASLRLFKFDPVEFVGPHFVRSKIFQKFLSRTNNVFNICVHLRSSVDKTSMFSVSLRQVFEFLPT